MNLRSISESLPLRIDQRKQTEYYNDSENLTSPIIPMSSSQKAPTTQASESPYYNYSPKIPKLQIILLNFRMPSSPSTPSYTAGNRKMHSGSARISRNLPSSNNSPQNGKWHTYLIFPFAHIYSQRTRKRQPETFSPFNYSPKF